MKRRNTPEARRFWELADKISRDVERWPDWKLLGFVGGERIITERKEAQRDETNTTE